MSNSINGEDVIVDKLTKAKRISTDLSYKLQLLTERVQTNIQNVDTSDVEDVTQCNEIIKLLNKLLESISDNHKGNFKPFPLVSLTDEDGNVVTDNRDLVVGYFFIEDSIATYYKCRIVEARTYKEAVYKYQKKLNLIDSSITCFGEYSEDSEYCKAIEDLEKII
jgi:hypothetical protein